jgi:hypothetical protein
MVEQPRSGATPAIQIESQSPRPPSGGWGKHFFFVDRKDFYNISTVTKLFVTLVMLFVAVTKLSPPEGGRERKRESVTKLFYPYFASRYKTHLLQNSPST